MHAAFFFGLGFLFYGLTKNRTNVKQVLWAVKNPAKARWVLAGLQIAGASLACFLGFLLSTSAIMFSPLWGALLAVPYLLFFVHRKMLPKQSAKRKNFTGRNFTSC
jgi:hypothetical protein